VLSSQTISPLRFPVNGKPMGEGFLLFSVKKFLTRRFFFVKVGIRRLASLNP
jgi:hypothetical protein